MWTDLSSILSQSTRLTDGQTDRILIGRPRVHFMQRGKNVKWPESHVECSGVARNSQWGVRVEAP